MISVFFLFIHKHGSTIIGLLSSYQNFKFQDTPFFPVSHHCKSPTLSAHNFQPITSQHCQHHRDTLDVNEQSEREKIQILMKYRPTDDPSTPRTELTYNSQGTPAGQIGEHLTHTQASPRCDYRVAIFPVCLPSVPGEIRVQGGG